MMETQVLIIGGGGARYICSDPEAAVECCNELNIIKKTAGHCVEETGGWRYFGPGRSGLHSRNNINEGRLPGRAGGLSNIVGTCKKA